VVISKFMKPFKTRIEIYVAIMISLVMLVVGLLFTGYDYSRSKGFYVAADRSAMSFGEVIMALPSALLIPMLLLLGIMIFIEILAFLFSNK